MEKIAGYLPASQQMVDEANAVAKEQGWDTLMDDIRTMWQTSWDRANTAIMNGDPI